MQTLQLFRFSFTSHSDLFMHKTDVKKPCLRASLHNFILNGTPTQIQNAVAYQLTAEHFYLQCAL